MKRSYVKGWKEAPLDSLVLSLYHLQAFYLNETKRGLAGLGNYTVAPKYQAACLDQVAVQYLPTNCPEDIVKRIREGERNGEIPPVKVKKEGDPAAAHPQASATTAAKLIMGMSVSTQPARGNLTQLRRNTRSKKDKKSGRKKPRAKDVEPEGQGEMHASKHSKYVLYKFHLSYVLLQMEMSLTVVLKLWECLNETDKLSGKKRPCVLLTVSSV